MNDSDTSSIIGGCDLSKINALRDSLVSDGPEVPKDPYSPEKRGTKQDTYRPIFSKGLTIDVKTSPAKDYPECNSGNNVTGKKRAFNSERVPAQVPKSPNHTAKVLSKY